MDKSSLERELVKNESMKQGFGFGSVELTTFDPVTTAVLVVLFVTVDSGSTLPLSFGASVDEFESIKV